MYNSIAKACKTHSWEIVFASPFEGPESLRKEANVQVISNLYCTPSLATMRAVQYAKGEYIYITVDDGIVLENSLDESLDFIADPDIGMKPNDVLNMRYIESIDMKGRSLPINFWLAHSHADLRWPGVSSNWRISLQPLMLRQTFIDFGGIDCQFEYSNHGLHDLMFRIQAHGGIIYNSPVDVCNAGWMPETSGDHAPIHHAQISHDEPIFIQMYQDPKAAYDRKLKFTDCERHVGVWSRRFPDENRLPRTYEEMVAGQAK